MTLEIDALHAGQPMRNSLDPCTSCADWQALSREAEGLRAALAAIADLDMQGALFAANGHGYAFDVAMEAVHSALRPNVRGNRRPAAGAEGKLNKP